jgi:hypothetical protein
MGSNVLRGYTHTIRKAALFAFLRRHYEGSEGSKGRPVDLSRSVTIYLVVCMNSQTSALGKTVY